VKKSDNFDIVIVGAGVVGVVAALAFQREGYKTCLVGPQNNEKDGRTVALFQGAVCFLDAMGVWRKLATESAPLEVMRIIDDTRNLFHVPTTSFRATELGLDAFGWNIANYTLLKLLSEAVSSNPAITHIRDTAASCTFGEKTAILQTTGGISLEASLIVAADGRRSVLRQQAGIGAKIWNYPQTALTTILDHERDHRNTSTEFHTRHGPFTLVPLPGRRSSLVWLTAPERSEELREMTDEDLARNIEEQAHHMLGGMTVSGPRAIVPMTGLSTDSYVGKRLALVGETAHVFPPIGAQGLNLGLRDVANLRDVLADAAGRNCDIGHQDVLRLYQRQRKLDVGVRTTAVDSLNRLLLAQYLPTDWLRSAGLLAIANIPSLRRMVMQMSMRPNIGTPQMMQGTVSIL